MKRTITIITVLLMALLLSGVTAYAGEGQPFDEAFYEELLASYDINSFEDELDSETRERLRELGLDNASLGALSQLRPEDALHVALAIVKSKAKAPLKGAVAVTVFLLLSSLFGSLKGEQDAMGELYGTVSAVTVAAMLIVCISPTVSAAAAAIEVAAGFIYAFIPVFITVVAASGGVTTAFSANALLLMLSQGLSALAANVFMPVINCMLAVGICASLRRELGLDGVALTMKKVISGAIAFIAGVYVSVLSVKTTLSARADVLGIRSARFVINSVVPVVGGAVSEGLLSIESYSSLIKSSVGIVGIAAIVLVFLPSVLEITLWRVVLRLSATVSRLFGESGTEGMLCAFADAMMLMYVVLVVSALTTVVSVGILIAAGG